MSNKTGLKLTLCIYLYYLLFMYQKMDGKNEWMDMKQTSVGRGPLLLAVGGMPGLVSEDGRGG